MSNLRKSDSCRLETYAAAFSKVVRRGKLRDNMCRQQKVRTKLASFPLCALEWLHSSAGVLLPSAIRIFDAPGCIAKMPEFMSQGHPGAAIKPASEFVNGLTYGDLWWIELCITLDRNHIRRLGERRTQTKEINSGSWVPSRSIKSGAHSPRTRSALRQAMAFCSISFSDSGFAHSTRLPLKT